MDHLVTVPVYFCLDQIIKNILFHSSINVPTLEISGFSNVVDQY